MLDRVNQQLGNYRLTRPLGQGGFADVYLGEHVYLNTLAAIKVLQMRLTDDDKRSFRDRVLADLAGGEEAGVHATPTFFVDGERLEGPWRQLAQIVPARLETASR